MDEMKQSIGFKRVRFLEPYEEIVGTLEELSFIEGLLVGRFGTKTIAIPKDMEDRIRPYIGKKLALLRTDIPEKQYLFRILDLYPTSCEKASVSEGCLSI
jgi:hypothetical protein